MQPSNPVFCTVLSVLNVIFNIFPSEVIGCGTWPPQNVPCSFEFASRPLRISTESYSQSCYGKDRKREDCHHMVT